jgi:hypothetical protein
MSKVDIRLLYQKASGHSLGLITNIAEYPEIGAECPDCGTEFDGDNNDAREYIEWLEEELELALSVGERLMRANMIHHIARST